MNKITIAVSSMLVALSLTGCHYELTVPENNGGIEVKTQKLAITASGAQAMGEDGTRTIMEGDKASGFNTVWEQATDKLGVYTYNAEAAPASLTKNAEFGITSLDNGVATFEGDINYDATDRTYDLYAYYPYNAGNSGTHDNVILALATEQTMPANGTHDPANDYMVALPRQMDVAGGEVAEAAIDNFEFRYIVGFMNLTVKDITAAGVSETEMVKSVEIRAQSSKNLTQLTGEEFRLNLTDGSWACWSGWDKVIVNLPEGVTLGELDAWGVVNPFAADRMTFTITTDNHIIEKVATADGALRGDMVLEAGGIKTFNMTIDDSCKITPIGVPGDVVFVGGAMAGDWGGNPVRNITLAFADYEADNQNGIRLQLDLYATFDMDSSKEILDLPTGDYNFDNTFMNRTVSLLQDYTNIHNMVNGGFGQRHTLTGGNMNVEGDHTNYKLTFDLMLEGGKTLHAEYNGPLTIPNPSYIPPAKDIELGTLTNFLQMQHDTDPWRDGTVDGWQLAIADEGMFLEYGNYKGSGWLFESDIFTALNSSDILTGTFPLTNDYKPGTAQIGTPGYYGTWISLWDYSSTVEEWPLVEGSITSAYANGEYTITIDAYTSNGSHVTGTIQGAPSEETIVAPSASLQGASNRWSYAPKN